MGARKALIEAIVTNSIAKNFEEAALEWDVIACTIGKGTCICGQTGLQYLFTIRNRNTSKELFPIGSECIKKFNNEMMYSKAMHMYELLIISDKIKKLAKKEKKEIPSEISFKIFNRKLLDYMYAHGAFPANKWNRHNGYNDYEFALGTFNGRHHTQAQKRKEYMLLKQTIDWVHKYAATVTA